MADDRLPCRRSVSIVATRSESVRLRSPAICFSPCQNASSRLTLVLCPAITIDRLTTGDFIRDLLPGGVRRDRGRLSPSGRPRASIALLIVHASDGFQRRARPPSGAGPPSAPFSG